jgi:uncharacterized protein (TIRG00374 family)
MAVALAALAFLALKTAREIDTFVDAFKQIQWFWVLSAVLIYFVAQTLLASRWILLLRVHKVNISLFQTVKLTYLGLFYNNMMPGAVGGDLLKGWYITQHSDKNLRLEAAVTVFVDRLVGLIGMILVGALASLAVGSDLKLPLLSRQIQVRHLIWILLGALILAAIIFFSRRVRHALLLNKILDKLPFASFLRKIDDAIRIYRRHLCTMAAALVLTALIQGLSIVAIWMLTQSLNLDKVRFLQCLSIMPIIWLVSAAIPVPGGLGVMENLFVPFFVTAIDPAITPSADHWEKVVTLAAALAILNRLMICFCSLPGALVPIFGGHLPKPEDIEAELANETPEVKSGD